MDVGVQMVDHAELRVVDVVVDVGQEQRGRQENDRVRRHHAPHDPPAGQPPSARQRDRVTGAHRRHEEQQIDLELCAPGMNPAEQALERAPAPALERDVPGRRQDRRPRGRQRHDRELCQQQQRDAGGGA